MFVTVCCAQVDSYTVVYSDGWNCLRIGNEIPDNY